MKFVCMGFIDEAKYAALPEAEGQRMMEECMAYDDVLRRGGHFIGGEALGHARNAVTLRTTNGQVEVTDGPYAETKEFLGGILLLEARDMNHAIELMSKHPGVKVGPFEIRPADEAMNEIIAARGGHHSPRRMRAASNPNKAAPSGGRGSRRDAIENWRDRSNGSAEASPSQIQTDTHPSLMATTLTVI